MMNKTILSTRMSVAGALVLLWANCLIGAEFTVFAPNQKKSSISALSKVLRADESHSVNTVLSLQEALDADFDVLIIFSERDSEPQLEAEDIAELRKKKVIGIGYGAAKLFGDLGLEINGGACAHNSDKEPEIRIETNVGDPKLKGKNITAFRIDEPVDWAVVREIRRRLGLKKPSIPSPDNFAMFLPAKAETTKFVTALARRQGDENYAPVVKQGNFIMVGLVASPKDWTKEYKKWFNDIAGALAAEAKGPFAKAKWKTTQPGEYDFKLAPGGSTTDLSGRTFRFRFEKPTTFTATLEHSGSSNVMLMFMGENGSQSTRQDAASGETIRIEAEITEEEIEQLGDGYWKLRITNFDRSGPMSGKIVIEY